MAFLQKSLITAGAIAFSMSLAQNVSANSTTYQVKRGDTLYQIGLKEKVSVANLKSLNHLSSNTIYPGQVLKLTASASQTKPATSQNTNNSSQTTYIVRAGDTASAIASRYKMSLSTLQSLNHLTNINLIRVGQKLVVSGSATTNTVPSSSTTTKPASSVTSSGLSSSYVVKSGDTMSKIAAAHQLSLSTLLSLNSMKASQIIYVGQKIKVTGAVAASNSATTTQQKTNNQASTTTNGSYTVKSGDTLYAIATRNNMSLQNLLNLNHLTATTIIYPGQKLKTTGTSSTTTQTPSTPSQSTTTEIKYIAAADTNHDGFMTMAEYNAYQNQNHNNSSTVVSNNTVTQVSVGDIKTAGLSATQIAWLRSAIVDARSATAGTGVRASITVAQAIIESGWGSSALARAPYNNLFGIKSGSSWYGNQVMMRTGEYINGQYVTVNASFRAYASQESSFRDHTNFLLQNGRYASNGVINSSSYQSMAYGLQQAGYATDPNYASTLISVVQRYNLSVLD